MTQVSVSIDLAGTLTDLQQLEARAGNLTPAWTGPVDSLVRGMFAEVWATAGASIDAVWAPLSALTLALKARANRAGMGPLKFSQALYRSFTVRSSPDGIRDVQPLAYTFGSRVPYAALLNEGWTATTIFGRLRKQPVEVPGRRIVPDPVPATVLEQITGVLADYIVSGTV